MDNKPENKNGKKTNAWTFQVTNKRNLMRKNLDITKRGKFKKETEYLFLAAQNNAIKTNYVKTKMDKTHQNSRCRVCYDRDETINLIINEYCKLALKVYKTRLDWVGKVIHWERYKKFKFELTNKRFMHNADSVSENKMDRFLWDFE